MLAMKKIFTLLCTLTTLFASTAQNVLPNPGFENWTQVGTRMDPDNWNTLNPNTSIVGVLTCLKASGADVHSGNAAIKLITKSVLGQNANGLATTGTISIAPPGVSGGVAYTGRPDSIVGWYKYTSVSGDNGFVEFQLLGSASTPDTIGYVRFLTPASTVGTYTRFSSPIIYRSADPVAKSIWILSSSAGFTAQVNSTLFIDDLELITNTGAGVDELNEEVISISPNPAAQNLMLASTKRNLHFVLFDALGNQVIQTVLEFGKNKIDLNQLSSGLYFYTALNSDGSLEQRGKVIIAH